jgi:hypothetical protein
VEGDDRVARARRRPLERALDHLEERLRHLHPVDHHVPAEEPVARVLRVRLRHVEALDVARVAAQLLDEELRVVVEVRLVEAEAQLRGHLLQRDAPAREQRHRAHRRGHGVALEALERRVVHALGHPVMHRIGVLFQLHGRELGRGSQQVAPEALDARDLGEAARVADADCVGRPRSAEREPWAHLQQPPAADRGEGAAHAGAARLEGLGEQPEQLLLLGAREGFGTARQLDGEAALLLELGQLDSDIG